MIGFDKKVDIYASQKQTFFLTNLRILITVFVYVYVNQLWEHFNSLKSGSLYGEQNISIC